MARINDAGSPFAYAGMEPATPEANLEANHATKNGGPELSEVASGLKGSYGGQDSALPDCGYGSGNHAAVYGGKITSADE